MPEPVFVCPSGSMKWIMGAHSVGKPNSGK
jgi:hypothetical protein